MSVLVDRITAVLREHGDGPFINADCTGAGCECGWDGGEDGDWSAHVAERVAEALNLTEETRIRSEWNVFSQKFKDTTERRWVSPWTAVEPKPAEEKPCG